MIFFFLFKEGMAVFQFKDFTAGEFVSASVTRMEYDAAKDELVQLPPQRVMMWQPASSPMLVSLVPLIWGSLGIAILSALFSTFAGIGLGIFLSEMTSSKVRGFIKPALELLVGIPTVVVGFFMIMVIAEPMRRGATWLTGTLDSILTRIGIDTNIENVYTATPNMFIGAIGVSVVIIPVIASLVDDALRAVPGDLRAASLSLGATRWQTTRRVVLPAAVSGVLAAVILGFGRALGETMIVLMCSGNAPQLSANPFEPVRTMTATIAAEMGTAPQGGRWYHTLFFVGALLVTITFILNVVVELIVSRYRKKIRL